MLPYAINSITFCQDSFFKTGHGTNVIEIYGVDNLNKTTYQIPKDRIELATYGIAAAVTDGELIMKNCTIDLLTSVIPAFNAIGIGYEQTGSDIKFYKKHAFKSCNIITSPYPGFATDIQAQIMIPLCLANGVSHIEENIFENRFMHVAELNRMGADISISGHTATIKSVNMLYGSQVMATDLRASVSLVIAGLIAKGTTTIDRIYHLNRGYENLVSKLAMCGADISITGQ